MLVLVAVVAVVVTVMKMELMIHKVKQVVYILVVQVYGLVFNHLQLEQ